MKKNRRIVRNTTEDALDVMTQSRRAPNIAMKLASALVTELAEPNSAPSRLPPDALATYCDDGADASRRAIGAADCHPLSARRCAPAISG
ncbi:MAG: hypothetical protein QME66_12565 [Candidatus Eisenbacteria bacterium]|nr:hypothetical protein [Candidatus Eisenbacteria bacterium]